MSDRLFARVLIVCLVAFGCGGAPPRPPSSHAEAPATVGNDAVDRALATPALELCESFPVETTLDHPDIRDAHDVWVEMIDGARTSLDIAQFYISPAPGGRLDAVLAAVERAAGRGVAVRLLVDERFYDKYPDAFERLRTIPGIEGRRLDVRRTSGGVHHAKYFLVDGREAYVGSQNFDWRALEHIQELGVRVRDPRLTATFAEVFAIDWAAAVGGGPVAPPSSTDDATPALTAGELAISPALSPKGWLSHGGDWDLPRLLAAFRGAERSIDIQLLSYETKFYDGSPFVEIDDVLREAVRRGVRVRLIVSAWADDAEELAPLHALAAAGADVRLMHIPPWSGGPIDFARTVHAKYLVVDDDLAWIGTSNFSGDYFYKSRNVGLIVRGAPFAEQLRDFFEDGWDSTYAKPVNVP